MTAKRVWDFVSPSNRDVIEEWAKHLSKADQGALLQRLIRLRQCDRQEALASGLIAGPLRTCGNLYKLRAYGDVQLRPHLCDGPLHHGREYTLLCGAVERGGKLEPRDVADRAIHNRAELKPENANVRRRKYFGFTRQA